MSANITITVTPQRRQPVTIPQPIPAKTAQPQPIPQDRVIVRPRFMGDSFVYVPERVPCVNEDGTPIPSPTERFLNWLFGTG